MNTPDGTNLSQSSFLRNKILRKYWQPPITTRSSFPMLITICLVFTVLSFILLIMNSRTYYQEVDYTYCLSEKDSKPCIHKHYLAHCFCRVEVRPPVRYVETMRIYYKISYMYQNHRLYAESFSYPQQFGNTPKPKDAESCTKLHDIKGQIIIPCGLVPNSMFNDTFNFFADNTELLLDSSNIITLPETKTFVNPNVKPLEDAFKDYAKPPNWRKPIYELDLTNPDNNGFLNRRYITWMRIYPFPNVLKQLGEIHDFSKSTNNKEIWLNVSYNYNVGEFGGKKSIILAESFWLGLPNTSLGYIYCASSIVSLLFLISFWLSTYLGVNSQQNQI